MKAFVFANYQEKFNELNKKLNWEQIEFQSIKFKNGEGKIVINNSVKDEDVIIFSDFSYSTSYKYLSKKRKYSKDEYNVELKRLISALDNPKSITLYLPLMYQSRQNAENEKESKDFLLFVNELVNLKVNKIITFEAHGNDEEITSYSLSKIFTNRKYDVVVSPDAGGYSRAKEYSKTLKCEDTCFKKMRDLSTFIDGGNPISKYQKSRYDFTNKNVLIVDDILDSGKTIINAIERIDNASKIDVFITYPLFSNGVKEFKKLYKSKKLNKLYISDLIHIDNKILKYDFIEVVNTDFLVCEILKGVGK